MAIYYGQLTVVIQYIAVYSMTLVVLNDPVSQSIATIQYIAVYTIYYRIIITVIQYMAVLWTIYGHYTYILPYTMDNL